MTRMVNDMRKVSAEKITVPNTSTLTVDGNSYALNNTAKTITYKGKTILSGISGFAVSLSNSIVDLKITTVSGATLQTTYSVLRP